MVSLQKFTPFIQYVENFLQTENSLHQVSVDLTEKITWATDSEINALGEDDNFWEFQYLLSKGVYENVLIEELNFMAHFKNSLKIFETLFSALLSCSNFFAHPYQRDMLSELIIKHKGLCVLLCKFLAAKYHLIFYSKHCSLKHLYTRIYKNVVYKDQVLKKHHKINSKYKKERKHLKACFETLFYESQSVLLANEEVDAKVKFLKQFLKASYENILQQIKTLPSSRFQNELCSKITHCLENVMNSANEPLNAAKMWAPLDNIEAEFVLDDLKSVFDDYYDDDHKIVRLGTLLLIPIAVAFLVHYIYCYWVSSKRRKQK